MKKQFVKATLFTLASLVAIKAQSAESQQELTLLEDLPTEQRVIVHQAVVEFLKANPELADSVKVIAVDKNGDVYVLDENKITLPVLGEPSCVSM